MGICSQEHSKRKKDLENNKEDKEKIYEINKEKCFKIYDAIYLCKSIKELFDNGWDYILFYSFIKKIKSSENNLCPISIIGEKNRGKTFILNLLTNNLFDNEIKYKIEGICCKLGNIDNEDEEDDEHDELSQNNLLFFDMSGKSEPLLIESENKNTLTNEELKKIVETNSKDLKISENFMQNLLIRNCKILIVVVNQLSLSEQIFLYNLKNENNYEKLIVIHNLFKFKQREDIENYLENTIVNSIFFDLTKNYFYDDESQDEIDEPYYFTEEIYQHGNKYEIIIHLILGNIDSNDLWIKYLNERTLDFLKYYLRVQHESDFLNIDDIIKKELINENIIDKEQNIINSNNIKVDNIKKEDEYLIGKLSLDAQKYKKNYNDFLFDNINFYFNEYIPNYMYYIDKKNSLFIIEIECSGLEDKNISITAKQKKDKIYFYIKGKKIFPKELKEIQPNKFSDKSFSFNFSFNFEKEEISIDISKEINEKKPFYKYGIYRKEFPLKKIIL